jgi:hypothetical protein
MVVHDCVCAQVNGKHRTEVFDSIHNPLSAVLEIEAGEWIGATQEGTSHASGDAVVIGCVFN